MCYKFAVTPSSHSLSATEGMKWGIVGREGPPNTIQKETRYLNLCCNQTITKAGKDRNIRV